LCHPSGIWHGDCTISVTGPTLARPELPTRQGDAMKPRLSRLSHVTTRVIAVLALLALLLPSLSAVSAAQGTAGDKVLRIRQPFWPDVVDPQKSSYAEEIAVSSLDYEGLTRFDEDLQTVPAAAES
jgi:ABC-type transport system substrate-binding protein